MARKRRAKSSKKENDIIDFSIISSSVIDGISECYKDSNISMPKDITNDEGYVPHEKLKDYDLFICDISGDLPQVHYLSGLVEGIGKPIIFISNNEHRPILDIAHKNILMYSSASIEQEFRTELNEWIQKAINNPHDFIISKKERNTKPKAFISYSHANKEYLSRLMVHLKPLEKKGLIDIWKDTDIQIGDKWREEIDKALSNSNIAILLLSADFMASDFIIENELPPLLAKAEVKGTKIVPIILTPCRFLREPSLSRFQAANLPHEPLSKMDEVDREAIYDKISADIENALEQT
jgi:hypothetical protein